MTDDIREDLMDAIESSDEEEAIANEVIEEEEEVVEEVTDEEVTEEPEPETETEEVTDEEVAEEVAADVDAITDDAPATKMPKAPISWSPQEREDWSGLKPSLQQRIITREKEVTDLMAESKNARSTHEYISKLSEHYAPVLQAEGVSNPLDAIGSLFQTVGDLRNGSSSDKSQVIANLINSYGVDVGDLAAKLEGTAADTPAQQQQPMTDPRLDQLLAQLQQVENRNQTAEQNRMVEDVKAFGADKEFMGDLSNDMADLIDLHAARGTQLSLQDAYDRAIRYHPEINAILDKRKKQASSVADKKKAAKMISGKKSSNKAAQPQSLRDTLTEAFSGGKSRV